MSARELPRAPAAPARCTRGARWILAAATAWCRLETLAAQVADARPYGPFVRAVESAQRASGALWSAALSVQEQAWLTVRIYENCPDFRAPGNELFEIESTLFARRLPRPPARILVGACGTGREAVALAAQGYAIDAFDPAQGCVLESRRRLTGRARVCRLSYEELSGLVLGGAEGDAPSGPFDAIVLGCGSLSHVLDPHEQRRLMQALNLLCPSGPIVASFLWVQQLADAPMGRAARLGSGIGRAIARLRAKPPSDSGRVSYRSRRGFAYTFTQREFEDLARGVDRRVDWEQHTGRRSLYATLLPTEPCA